MIWASVKRLFFIGISSSILPRKFYVRTPLTMERITAVPGGLKLLELADCITEEELRAAAEATLF
jgi:hypothetical protein